MKCGLLGRHLAHSYSPQIHSFLGEYPYGIFEQEPDDVADFIKNGDYTGINVTIPYKKTVIPFLDKLTETAKKMGAVNTIVHRDGMLIGHNTDYFGFASMVKKSGLSVAGKKVLVLGSGGASNTAVAVLREMGAEVVIISRSGENNYENLHLHSDAAVIINATPVGMYPNTGISPVELEVFPNLEGVLDIIYNPARTKLLLDAENRGLVTENGLWMLVAQAKESAEWFTGKAISDEMIGTIHRALKAQMENIILVGMPGCGKSTIATLLSASLGRPVVDADMEIQREAGCTIPEIFATGGEDAFRSLESVVLGKLGKESGSIIATGGGCVTRERNYPLLHQNGKIIWLQRDIDQLPTDGRPLSADGKLHQMYAIREPLYRRFADYTVSNNTTPEETVQKILLLLGAEGGTP